MKLESDGAKEKPLREERVRNVAMILFRPIGAKELALVEATGRQAWPPRLPDQPFFYPVLTFEYAEKIARDWNSVRPAPDNLGFVTRFEIDAKTASRYPVQQAGGQAHRELWVPAGELDHFNQGLVGLIEVVARYKDGRRWDDADGPGKGPGASSARS